MIWGLRDPQNRLTASIIPGRGGGGKSKPHKSRPTRLGQIMQPRFTHNRKLIDALYKKAWRAGGKTSPFPALFGGN
jgi:hypothetical protein